MSGYRAGSNWSDLNELRCLLALKQLEEVEFPRNMHSNLARDIAQIAEIPEGSVKAKISNYKSIAGITGHSNASLKSQSMYRNYGHLSSSELKELIESGKF